MALTTRSPGDDRKAIAVCHCRDLCRGECSQRQASPFCASVAAVDVCPGEVDLATDLQVLGQRISDPMEHAILHPLPEAPMARLVRQIAVRHVRPGGPGSQDPKHSIEHIARAPKRTPAFRCRPRSLLLRQARGDRRPLLIGRVHHDHKSENRSTVDPLRKSGRIPRSYVSTRL